VSHHWSVDVFVKCSFFWITSRNCFHFQRLFCVGFYVPLVMLLKFPSALEYQAKKSLNLMSTALRSFNCPPPFSGFHTVTSREIKIFKNHFIYYGGCFIKFLLFRISRSFHTQTLKMILARKVRKSKHCCPVFLEITQHVQYNRQLLNEIHNQVANFVKST